MIKFVNPLSGLTGKANNELIKVALIVVIALIGILTIDSNTVNDQTPAKCGKTSVAVSVPKPHIWGVEKFTTDKTPTLRDVAAEKAPAVPLATVSKLNNIPVMGSLPKTVGGIYCLQLGVEADAIQAKAARSPSIPHKPGKTDAQLAAQYKGERGFLTDAQIAGVVVQAGAKGDERIILFAIAKAESAGDTRARCYNLRGKCVRQKALQKYASSIDRGLFQINNSAHPQVSEACADNPVCAGKYALTLARSKRGWRHWVTYTSGSWKKQIPVAERAGL